MFWKGEACEEETKEANKRRDRKEIEKVERIARMIGKKWPKGKTSVDIIREQRRQKMRVGKRFKE